MPALTFRAHTGEVIDGERLETALKAVGDWYEQNARSIRANDPYAAHVSEETKDANLAKYLDFADRVRRGEQMGFSVWQRVNMELTGECVGFLPRA